MPAMQRLFWAMILVMLPMTGCKSGPAGTAMDGTPLSIQVLDLAGNPIPWADVRNPTEGERHSVNSVTGIWTGNKLYPTEGEPVEFVAGMEVVFEISASGYITESVRYLMRKRKNLIIVRLQEMDMEGDREPTNDPMISFGRDKPLDGKPIE